MQTAGGENMDVTPAVLGVIAGGLEVRVRPGRLPYGVT